MPNAKHNYLSFDDCVLYLARVLLRQGEKRALETADGFERSVGFDAGKLMREARRLAVD